MEGKKNYYKKPFDAPDYFLKGVFDL